MFGRSRPCRKIFVLRPKGKAEPGRHRGRTGSSNFRKMLLLRGFGEPLLGSSHQNILMRISQSLLPSIYQLPAF